ncbi:MAG: hypothetical protein K8J31_04935, partial [Anaerolineae bacterium]|nr:hypothetical protein [Anaerolineae bacterium]
GCGCPYHSTRRRFANTDADIDPTDGDFLPLPDSHASFDSGERRNDPEIGDLHRYAVIRFESS